MRRHLRAPAALHRLLGACRARYLFPMCVVKVTDILQMEGAPEPHDVLLEKGLLHQWQPGAPQKPFGRYLCIA